MDEILKLLGQLCETGVLSQEHMDQLYLQEEKLKH